MYLVDWAAEWPRIIESPYGIFTYEQALEEATRPLLARIETIQRTIDRLREPVK
jgi:hypothetical protein